MMNKSIKALIGFGIAGMALSCSGHTEQAQESRSINVKTITATEQTSALGAKYVGSVEADVSSKVSFTNAGTVRRVYVSEGQSIAKGTLIAELDPTLYTANYTAAKASYDQAQDAVARLRQMYESNSLPEIKYVEAKTQLERAKAQYDAASRTLSDTKLYAPMSGIVGKQLVQNGENVNAGSPIITLLDIHKVQVKVSVPEREIARLTEGSTAEVVIPVLGDTTYIARLSERSVVADPLARTYDAKFALPNVDKRILPGMVCNVSVQLAGATGRSIVLPNDAVQVGDRGYYVWLVEGGKAQQRGIEVGDLRSEGVVVSSGLKAGDKVIVEGMNKLSRGSRVVEK